MTLYKSRPELFQASDRDPTPHRNSGWRRNMRNWQKLFEYPSRAMMTLISVIEKTNYSFQRMKVVFDPEWKGRFGNCPDGGPIMFTAELSYGERICYLDLRDKDPGANKELYKARTAYCDRNNIPLIILYNHYTKDEMTYLIDNWIRKEK
jgi:hypothetical protein